MRNRLRVLAFDIAAPLAAIAALIYIGIALAWPLWWVSLCVGAVPADRPRLSSSTSCWHGATG